MPTVQASKDDAWVIRDLVRKKFIQELNGKNIANPSAFVNSAEGQELYAKVKGEVETFVGYTMEEAEQEGLKEDLSREIEYASRTLGDEKAKDGTEEFLVNNPEEIME